MPMRFDTPLITGAYYFGTYGVGTVAANIPTSGDAGASMLANDILGGDPVGCRYRVEILTWPSQGKLFVNEDGSGYFDATGIPDGTYSGTQRVWKNGVDDGSTTYAFAVGNASNNVTLNLTLPQVGLSASASTPIDAALGVTLPQVALSATASTPIDAALAVTLPQVSLSAAATTPIDAALGVTLPQVSLLATATLPTPINATLSVTLAQVALLATATVSSGSGLLFPISTARMYRIPPETQEFRIN